MNRTKVSLRDTDPIRSLVTNMRYSYVNKDDSVESVINHPAFKKFGQYLFPLEKITLDESIKLNDINDLLPYHHNINADTTVNSINYMIDKVENGETIFYDYYTKLQKKEDQDKESTGLFFFRGKSCAPFAVICAGGAFSYIGSIHEGFPYAIELNKFGCNAFVMQYRIGNGQRATEDLAAAITYIFNNAKMLQVDIDNYSLWGSSAGAIMAAKIGSYGTERFGGDMLPKPIAVIMAYSSYSDYSENEPATFAVVGEEDKIARSMSMEHRILELKNKGIPAEFHKYPSIGHGFGLGINTSAEGWVEKAVRFWESQIYYQKK